MACGLPSVLAERAHLRRVLVRCAQSKADRPAARMRENVGGDRSLIDLSPLGMERTLGRCSPREEARPRGEAPVLAGAGRVGVTARLGRAGEKVARSGNDATALRVGVE